MTPCLALLFLAAAPSSSATVTVRYDTLWTSAKGPLQITLGSLPPITVAEGATSKPLRVAATASGTIVDVKVKLPEERHTWTRRVVMLAGASYLLRGNECSRFEVAPQPEARFQAPQLQFDSSKISKASHPLRVLSDLGSKPKDDVEEAVLPAPGSTAPLALPLSAMCPRAGARMLVVTADRTVLFDESLVLPEGRTTTVTFAADRTWALTVGPLAAVTGR